MGYLKRRSDGAVTDWLSPDSQEYILLKAMKFTADTAALTPTGSGIISGETGGTIKSGQPMWEDVAEEDAGFPDPTGGRVFVVALPGAAVGADETVQVGGSGTAPEVAGSLTEVGFVPNAPVVGQASNYRTITLNQVTVSGTASPARAVTALAAVAFSSAGVTATPGQATALTVSQAAFTSVPPDTLEVVSSHTGTGLVDPGGVLYGVYTRS